MIGKLVTVLDNKLYTPASQFPLICLQSKAQQLEMVKTCKYGGGGIGAPSKEESLREAAAIEVRLGNLQKYCEILVQLGEWDKALSVAPGVSMAYWKSLAERHAKQLMTEDSDATVPYCVATGEEKRKEEIVYKFECLYEICLRGC